MLKVGEYHLKNQRWSILLRWYLNGFGVQKTYPNILNYQKEFVKCNNNQKLLQEGAHLISPKNSRNNDKPKIQMASWLDDGPIT